MNPEEVSEEYFKYLERAQFLMDVGRWREALHELRQHLSAYPDSYDGYCQSAICHLQLKEFQRAFDLTKKAIELAPEGEWAYRVQSIVFSENGESKRALEAARLAAERAPYFPPSFSCLFWAQANSGYYDEAEETLKLLLELAPDSAETHEAAGYLALQRKDNTSAEKHYVEALKIDPESVNAMNNLGVVYLNLAQSGKGHHFQKRSVEMFERAVRQQPTFKLGQENISHASSAFKFGAPAGIGILLWLGLQVFGRGMSWLFEDRSTLFVLTPVTSSYLLTAANFLFLFFMFAATLYIAGLFVPRFKSTLRYHFVTGYTWPAAFGAFGLLLILYSVGLWKPETERLGMSVAGFGISLVVTLIAGLNVFQLWKMRRALQTGE